MNITRMLLLALIIGSAIATTDGVTAQVDCAAILSTMKATAPATDDGYHQRGGGANDDIRCEGVFDIATSGRFPELAIVSFTIGKVSFAQRKSLILLASVAPWAVAQSDGVMLRVAPLSEGKNYQLDAVVPKSGALVWPAGSLLEAYGLSSNMLGAYAVRHDKTGPVFMPVALVGDPLGSAKKDAVPQQSKEALMLAVRYPYTLATLGWRVGAMSSSGDCMSSNSFTQIDGPLQGRVSIPISLPEAVGNCLEFRLRRPGARATAERVVVRVALPTSAK